MSLPKISNKTHALQTGRRVRKDHLAMIRVKARTVGADEAMVYWLRECAASVSKKSFMDAIRTELNS